MRAFIPYFAVFGIIATISAAFVGSHERPASAEAPVEVAAASPGKCQCGKGCTCDATADARNEQHKATLARLEENLRVVTGELNDLKEDRRARIGDVITYEGNQWEAKWVQVKPKAKSVLKAADKPKPVVQSAPVYSSPCGPGGCAVPQGRGWGFRRW